MTPPNVDSLSPLKRLQWRINARGGTVTFHTFEDGQTVRIDVSDTHPRNRIHVSFTSYWDDPVSPIAKAFDFLTCDDCGREDGTHNLLIEH